MPLSRARSATSLDTTTLASAPAPPLRSGQPRSRGGAFRLPLGLASWHPVPQRGGEGRGAPGRGRGGEGECRTTCGGAKGGDRPLGGDWPIDEPERIDVLSTRRCTVSAVSTSTLSSSPIDTAFYLHHLSSFRGTLARRWVFVFQPLSCILGTCRMLTDKESDCFLLVLLRSILPHGIRWMWSFSREALSSFPDAVALP